MSVLPAPVGSAITREEPAEQRIPDRARDARLADDDMARPSEPFPKPTSSNLFCRSLSGLVTTVTGVGTL